MNYEDVLDKKKTDNIKKKFSEYERAVMVVYHIYDNPNLLKIKKGRDLLSHCKQVIKKEENILFMNQEDIHVKYW